VSVEYSSRRVPIAIWCAAGVFLLAVFAATFALIVATRTKALADHSERVAGAVSTADAEINRMLLSIDMLLAGVEKLARPSERLDGTIDHDKAGPLLTSVIDRDLLVRDIAFIGPDSTVLTSAQPSSKRLGMSLPKGFVADVLRETPPAMVMSRPADSVVIAEPVVYFGRAVEMVGGHRAVVVAEVPIGPISALLAAGIDLRHLTVTLEQGDGRLVTSAPPSNLDGTRLRAPITQGIADGIVRQSVGRTGEASAIVAVRPTLYRSVFVTSSTPLEDVLAQWNQDRIKVAAVSLLFAVMLLITAGVSHWHWALVSNARKAEQEAVARMRAAVTEKGAFLASTSHDLRTPLQSILLTVDLLALRLKDNAPEEVRWLRRSSQTMERLLRDLLTLAKGEAGTLEIVPEPFEACEFVLDVAGEHQDSARAKGLRLEVNVPPGPIFVVADHWRVSQILTNLLSNAVKYTLAGEVIVSFEKYGDGKLYFSVKDSGPGIPEDFIPTMFSPFRRRAAIDRNESSGIGLAIVQTLANHLAATVRVESEIGKGSVFRVEVPAAPYHEDDVTAAKIDKHQAKLLIVDDHRGLLNRLAAVASELGYPTDTADSAATAANLLNAQQYDLVLIDLEMRHKSGKQLASEIRRGKGCNRNIPLIAMSASSDGRAIGQDWPFNGFMQKGMLDHRKLTRLIEASAAAKPTPTALSPTSMRAVASGCADWAASLRKWMR